MAYAAVLAFMVFVFGAIPFVDAVIVQYVDAMIAPSSSSEPPRATYRSVLIDSEPTR